MQTQLLPQSPVRSNLLEKIADFCQSHNKDCAKWERDRLAEWLQWHFDRELLGIVLDGEEIVAVATVRCLKRAKDRFDAYFHDKEGSIAYCSMLTTTSPKATMSLLCILMRDFYQPKLAFTRNLSNYKCYDLVRFIKRYKGMNYG